jgi:hypothetical protein
MNDTTASPENLASQSDRGDFRTAERQSQTEWNPAMIWRRGAYLSYSQKEAKKRL